MYSYSSKKINTTKKYPAMIVFFVGGWNIGDWNKGRVK
jgi:exopolysaccharide biosynthesis predicted pyruvyltransferase EpsI